MKAPEGLRRLWWHVPALEHAAKSSEDMAIYDPDRVVVELEEQANAVSSLTTSHGWHLPVIDIDVPARLVPSSTPGHSHLYIDVPMTWGQFDALLSTLVDVGVVEPGYLAASRARETTFVRKPGCTKPAVCS